MDSLPLALRR